MGMREKLVSFRLLIKQQNDEPFLRKFNPDVFSWTELLKLVCVFIHIHTLYASSEGSGEPAQYRAGSPDPSLLNNAIR